MPGKKKKAPGPAVQLSPMPLVRVFRLNDEQGWDDYGVGHATIDYLEGSTDEVALVVIDSANDDTMLLHLITADDIYRKQEDKFISWNDPEAGMQLSLSFGDAAECSLIWDTICEARRKLHAGLLAPQVSDGPSGHSHEMSSESRIVGY